MIGLEPGARYRYALYQYTSDVRWIGHESSVSINGDAAFTTSMTGGTEPTSTGSFVAGSDGSAQFLFTRVADMHTAFSGLSVSKMCPGETYNCDIDFGYTCVCGCVCVHNQPTT